ncbi:hypothetical protein CHS0354_026562 [Potamilus streckersoni]|uniref:Uncharacterized protein n=1 Tax=Potamilus streckersoni TaxID=2493646 RepID=A0AAE0RQE4_9BIVA|nr:hypothetical protein CHS0354_026562 [Potamilus streckersoni]
MAQCNYDATTGFRTSVVVEKGATDTVYQISALTSSKAIAVGCTVGQVGTTNQYTSIYTVNPTGTTVTPAACASAFLVADSNSDNTVDEVTFTFLVQSINGYIFDTDAVFKWKCTKADPKDVLVETFTMTGASSLENILQSIDRTAIYIVLQTATMLPNCEIA